MGNFLSSINEDGNSTLSSYSTSSLPPRIHSNAESLRREAGQLRSDAIAASEQSQNEYRFGSKAQAKVLSLKKADLYRQMHEKNQQAAALIFDQYNRHRPADVIDLHGLYVEEALKYLQQKLNKCRSEGILRLTVITGIGNNSPNNIAKIKPKVEEFARHNCLKIILYRGHIVVDLTTDNQHETTAEQNISGCIIL